MAMTPQMKEAALQEYLDECQEMLERLSRNVSKIEKGERDKELLASIYRDMHTIKGTSQLFGFAQVGQLAHALETCLDLVRKNPQNLSDVLVDNLYAGLDIIASLLAGIRETKLEPDMGDTLRKILPRLVSIAESSLTGSVPPSKDKYVPVETSANAKPSVQPDAPAKVVPQMTIDSSSDGPIDGLTLFNDSVSPSPTPTASFPPPPAPAPSLKEAEGKGKQVASTKSSGDDQQAETIRVHVTLLDSLMNLVGELVLIRNQLLQHAKVNDDDTEFMKVSQRLNILTAELQNEVMKTRMQPIGNILNKFTRVIRDLGKELGKRIDLDLQGAETELDKTIIEAVKDPLTHIVRNAVDHGIESIAERKAAGKKDTGVIRLKAYHESGQVIIEIADDGRGLDRQRIGGKAVEKGLITAEAFAKMSDKEVQGLIFAPGFSTASLTNISGRGVGMDVVKTNVEKIGGVVDLASTPGEGTTIKLRIPLTLAIVPALIVRARGQRFAIPQTKLVQLLRIDASESGAEKIESLQGRPVLRLRGKLLPIIDLGELLGGKVAALAPPTTGLARRDEQVSNVVVLSADAFSFGLIVDEIDDSVDIVVKSLSNFLKDIKVFSGATILGDGSVALTIDVMGIADTAKLAADPAEIRDRSGAKAGSGDAGHRSETCEFLLIDVGAPGSYAIPLTVVSRIEEFDNERFERSGEQRVVRYRDALLPVFSLPDFLKLPDSTSASSTRERTPVVVIKRGDRSYGIEVRDIQDIIAVEAVIDQSVKDRKGIFGSLIAQDRVIVVVDVFEMLDELRTRLEVGIPRGAGRLPGERQTKSGKGRGRHRILVVEDSSFFRNYMRQVLVDAGFTSDVACDGAEGFAALENAPAGHYSLVLSDIEMPTMDGYELAKKIRATPGCATIPLVAITTRFSASDIEHGHQAGFTKYLEKLNAEKLIQELDVMLCGTTPEETKHAANG